MKLIVGIGNPDPEYAQTRHNVGWQFLDWLVKKHGEKDIDGIRVQYLKPDTYVNKSGDAVAPAMKKAKAKPADVIVVHDDLDIPFGNCKLSFEKDSAGHKGVESIMRALKTKKFWRVRIGTGVRALDKAREQSDKKRDEFVHDFVLHTFTPSQREELKKVFKDCEVRVLQALKQ